jgi:hypothetical protein
MICDFCSSHNVVATFPAADFIMPPFEVDGITPASRGNWEACAECAAFCVVKDWNGLARRAAEILISRSPHLYPELGELQGVLFVIYAGMLEPNLRGQSFLNVKEVN